MLPPASCNGFPLSLQALSRNYASKMPIMQRKGTRSSLRIVAHPKLTMVGKRDTSVTPTFCIASLALSVQISSCNEARTFPLHCFICHMAPFLCSPCLSRCSPYCTISSLFPFHLFFLCHLGLPLISFLLLTASQFVFTGVSSHSYFYILFPWLIS